MGTHFMYGDLLKTEDVDAIVHQVNCLCKDDEQLQKDPILRTLHIKRDNSSFICDQAFLLNFISLPGLTV